MRHRSWSVALLFLFLTTLPLSRGEAKPPKPPPVSNPVIVYQCDGGICVANEDGTAAYNILPYGVRPNWRGQGSGTLSDPYRIVFEDPFGVMNVLDLALVNGVPTATNIVPLETPFDAHFPEFSPLGDAVISIQYVACNQRGGRVWMTPAWGGDSALLYQADVNWFVESASCRYDCMKIAFSVRNTCLFVPSFCATSACVAMFVMNTDGSALEQVTPWYEGIGMEAEWSPVGELIAFTGVGDSGIHILDLSDGSITRVTTEGGHASWSPDGTKLVYGTGPGFHRGYLNVLNLSTGENRLIIRGGASDPHWRN